MSFQDMERDSTGKHRTFSSNIFFIGIVRRSTAHSDAREPNCNCNARSTRKGNLVLGIRKMVGVVGCASLLLTACAPVGYALAATYQMQTKSIALNGKILSKPSGFAYRGTTYLPVVDVQQLFDALKLNNKWSGKQWSITTPFSGQPSTSLKTKTGSLAIEINGKSFAAHVDKVMAVDPSSHKDTAFVPISYMIQTLQAIGLKSTWNGKTWNVEANDTDYTKTGTELGAFTKLSDAKAALQQYPGGTVKDASGKTAWTEPSFVNVDLRYPAPANVNAASINHYLTLHDSLMSDLGSVFMQAQSTYDVNANYLVSHALEETGSGGHVSNIALNKNNLFGYGAFDANAGADAGTFPSEAYAILFQAWEVRNNYLDPNSSHYTSPTLTGMASNYASDPNWANKINNLMDQFVIDLGDNVSSYKQYSAENQPAAPTNVESPPVYTLVGMEGTVQPDTYYENVVPVYATAGLGHQHMFARVLKQGDEGDDVATLQQALNITADGQFGPQTAEAVTQYQAAQGLAGTPGEVDFAMWNSLNLSQPQTTATAGTTLEFDGIVQGMAGGQVTEWFHVPSLNGWINASDVVLNNVYKISVNGTPTAADAVIPVDGAGGEQIATLHVGDYVISDGSSTGGKAEIQFMGTNGVEQTGYIASTNARLTQVER